MPGTVEFLAGLGVVLVALAVLGAMAQRWGADSRDWDRPTEESWFGGH